MYIFILFFSVDGNNLKETAKILANNSEIVDKFKQLLQILAIPQENQHRLTQDMSSDGPVTSVLVKTLTDWKAQQSLADSTVDAFVDILKKNKFLLNSASKCNILS